MFSSPWANAATRKIAFCVSFRARTWTGRYNILIHLPEAVRCKPATRNPGMEHCNLILALPGPKVLPYDSFRAWLVKMCNLYLARYTLLLYNCFAGRGSSSFIFTGAQRSDRHPCCVCWHVRACVGVRVFVAKTRKRKHIDVLPWWTYGWFARNRTRWGRGPLCSRTLDSPTHVYSYTSCMHSRCVQPWLSTTLAACVDTVRVDTASYRATL